MTTLAEAGRPAGRPARGPARGPARRPVRRPVRRRVRQFVPPQHGAWAMLAVPLLAGVLGAGWRWPDAPLLVAWLAGYLFSFYVFQALRARRVARYRDQLALYGTVTALAALPVVLARPQVLVYAPAYAALAAVNCLFAWRRQDRAALNDVLLVAESCLMVLVAGTVAGQPISDGVPALVVCLAYFTGTVLLVKSMIRERGNRWYARASVTYHAVLALAAPFWHPAMTPLAAWLLLRALWLPPRNPTPKQIGLLELANCAAVLAAATLLTA